MNEPWMDEARCAEVDPDLFFPERGDAAKDAKKVCGGCPVVDQCLQYALKNEFMDGIWGGTSANERRVMLGKVVQNTGRRRRERIEQMELFVDAGVSGERIAEAFGVSLDSMQTWCYRNGFPVWARLFGEVA